MKMDEVIIYVFVLVLFELFESQWQTASTIGGILQNIYRRYQRGIFYFIFSHPSFIYVLYLGIKYDLTNFWFLSILFMKFLDISYKLVIVKKIEENKLYEILPIPPDTPIPRWMGYVNVVVYPVLLYLAFISG